MKRIYTPIIALLLIVSISILSFNAQVVGAQDIDFDLDYSDPASDVTWVYENGTTEMRNDPKYVNIKWLRSELQPDNETIKLTIELASPGKIRTDNITIYQINIYTAVGNASHFIVNYTNGNCKLRTNTSASFINESIEYSISGLRLDCFVNLSELGNITYYNVDASAETREYENETIGWVLKKDFGWEVSGSPGTTPDDDLTDGEDGGIFDLGSDLCIISIVLALILVVVIIIAILARRRY
ncbi:MAG: hypothetical protein KAS67_02190 [Thermoplasmata archaeon]|nr:hypothetical protein [Thermoplasmata archaeon]